MNYPKDLTGIRFTRLLVKDSAGIGKFKIPLYVCECDCGKIAKVSRNKLVTKGTRSCGCLKSELSTLRSTKHGLSNTRMFQTFKGMKARCNNPKNNAYMNYGGRGIKIEWKSVQDFYDDMHESYDDHVSIYGVKETTIERIDVNGNYCKENCKWATNLEQAGNKQKKPKNEQLIELYGEKKTLAQWAKLMKVSKYRLNRSL